MTAGLISRDDEAADVVGAGSPASPEYSTAGSWSESLAAGALLTVWSLADRGFDGARWSDVPIIKSFVDPRLYRQDPFVWTLHNGTPAAYPYQLIAAVARTLSFLSLDQVLLAIYLPATVAALALLYRLGRQLIGDRLSVAAFLVLYVAGFRLVTVGSAILNSAETTPQTLALPFQLAALSTLLTGRLWLAGLLMGFAFNLHTPTTVYLAAALGLYLVVSARQLGFRRAALALGLLALAGSPTLVNSVLQHGDQLPLWALNLAKTELATDISLATHFSSRPLVIYNLLGLALTTVAIRAAPATAGRRVVLVFLVAVSLMCLGALVFFDLSLRTPLSTLVARLQLPRSAWLLDVFGLLLLVRFVTTEVRGRALPVPLALLLAATMLAAPPDFVPLDPLAVGADLLLLGHFVARRPALSRLAGWAVWPMALAFGLAGAARFQLKELDFSLSLRSALVLAGLALGWALFAALGRAGWEARRAAVPAVLVGLISAAAVSQSDNWLYSSAHKGGLKAAAEFQEWARTQTPLDSVFLILPSEPNNNTFYKNAERALFLVRERANQAIYFREQNFEFERRVRALGIDQPLHYREELDPAFRRLTEEQIRALARDFGVTYFVPARAGTFSFPIVYQSGGWTVYEVSSQGQ